MIKNVFLETVMNQQEGMIKAIQEDTRRVSFNSLLEDMPRTRVNCDLSLETCRLFYNENSNGYFVNIRDVESIKEAYDCENYRDAMSLIAEEFSNDGVNINNLHIAIKESDLTSMKTENNDQLQDRYSNYMESLLSEGVNVVLY